MALKIKAENKGAPAGSTVQPGKRLCVAANGAIVPFGDARAVALYCTENQSVSKDDYEARQKIAPPKLDDAHKAAELAKDGIEAAPEAKSKPAPKGKKSKK